MVVEMYGQKVLKEEGVVNTVRSMKAETRQQGTAL
jgi:hypothetical protein